MPDCVVGVDIGTTGVKTIALSQDGNVLGQAYHEHHLHSPYPGWAEESPCDWWKGTVATLQTVLAHIDPGNVLCIGVSGMVPALVLLNERGEPLRFAIQQNDARTTKELSWLKPRVNEKRFFELTGCTLNQQIIPPKLLWVRSHEPQIYEKIRWIMGSYDYINYKLTGNFSLEQNWVLEAGLWMAEERSWYEPILDLVEISKEWLPPVHSAHEVIGETAREVEEETGLRQGTPVIAGSADHIAAALASGAIEPGDLVLKFGGAGDILYCLDGFSPHSRLFIDYHNIPGKYLLNGCMASSGSLVKWFKNLLGGEGNSYEELDKEAEKICCGRAGLVVLPYFMGEKTPIFDPLARGVVFGLSLHHTKYHVHRAILESVVYAFRQHVEIIQEAGYPIQRILVVDQGAKSDLWRQISADVLGKDIHHVMGSSLESVFGVAFTAGVAIGVWKWDDIKDLSHASLTNRPQSLNRKFYDQMYRLYLDLYQHLKHDFVSLYQATGQN